MKHKIMPLISYLKRYLIRLLTIKFRKRSRHLGIRHYMHCRGMLFAVMVTHRLIHLLLAAAASEACITYKGHVHN